jgi:hypothetical protein
MPTRGKFSVYDSMEFPDYVYQEYPKMIDNDTRNTDVTSHAYGHGMGVLVNNKAEEDAYWASKKGKTAPVETEVNTADDATLAEITKKLLDSGAETTADGHVTVQALNTELAKQGYAPVSSAERDVAHPLDED